MSAIGIRRLVLACTIVFLFIILMSLLHQKGYF